MDNQGPQQFDEEYILQNFCEEIKILDYTSFQKKNPPNPDFKGIFENNNLWIEVTELLESNSHVVTTNKSIDKFCQELRTELEKVMEGKRFLVLQLSTLKLPKIGKQKQAVISKIVEMAKQCEPECNKTILSEKLPLELQDFHWLSFRQSRFEATTNDIRVTGNNFYSMEESSTRLVAAIKIKEEKNYRINSDVKDDQLWLLVKVDNASTLDEFEKIKVEYKSKIFNRVYLQLEYWPGTKSFPVKRIV